MKNNKGFTLVEVIISIGALGIICAVLLRLFVLAGSTNDIAADKQRAEMAATSVAETLLCVNTLDEGLEVLGAQGADGEYALTQDGYDVTLRVTPRGSYPGTLCDIVVQVWAKGGVIVEINTAKYYWEQNGV